MVVHQLVGFRALTGTGWIKNGLNPTVLQKMCATPLKNVNFNINIIIVPSDQHKQRMIFHVLMKCVLGVQLQKEDK